MSGLVFGRRMAAQNTRTTCRRGERGEGWHSCRQRIKEEQQQAFLKKMWAIAQAPSLATRLGHDEQVRRDEDVDRAQHGQQARRELLNRMALGQRLIAVGFALHFVARSRGLQAAERRRRRRCGGETGE